MNSSDKWEWTDNSDIWNAFFFFIFNKNLNLLFGEVWSSINFEEAKRVWKVYCRWIYVATSIGLFLAICAFIILLINYLQLHEQKICGKEIMIRGENVKRSEIMQQQPLILTSKIEFFRILRICLNFYNRERQVCIMAS